MLKLTTTELCCGLLHNSVSKVYVSNGSDAALAQWITKQDEPHTI